MTKTMTNASQEAVRFQIDGRPGAPPTMFDVPPGGTCEVPAGYVDSGLIAKIAPGLVPLGDHPSPPPQEPAPPLVPQDEDAAPAEEEAAAPSEVDEEAATGSWSSEDAASSVAGERKGGKRKRGG